MCHVGEGEWRGVSARKEGFKLNCKAIHLPLQKTDRNLDSIDNWRKFFFFLGFMHGSERVMNSWRQKEKKREGRSYELGRQRQVCLFISRRKEGRKSHLYRLKKLWFQK